MELVLTLPPRKPQVVKAAQPPKRTIAVVPQAAPSGGDGGRGLTETVHFVPDDDDDDRIDDLEAVRDAAEAWARARELHELLPTEQRAWELRQAEQVLLDALRD